MSVSRHHPQFLCVHSALMVPPKADLFAEFNRSLPGLRNGDVLFVSSKVLAIHQGRCLSRKEHQKSDVIRRESDSFVVLPGSRPDAGMILARKGCTVIPFAGVDESNGDGFYVLWPKGIDSALKQIRLYLKKRFALKDVGVVATDSTVTPCRWGTVGVAIGAVGIRPLRDYRGTNDLFGRAMTVTQVNVVDSIATMAVFFMGEGAERTPFVVGRALPGIEFVNRSEWRQLRLPRRNDLYRPLLDLMTPKPGRTRICKRARRDQPR